MSARARVGAALLVLGLLAGCSGSGDDPQKPGARATLPAPLPDIDLPVLGEGATTRNLADVERATLVNVWATWCAPCREEMPVLQEFAEKHAGVVDVLGINFQDPQEDLALKFTRETGVTYPSLRDVDGDINRLSPFPELRGLPFMVVVDADGQVVGQEFSLVKSLADVEKLVTEHLPDAFQADVDADAEEGEE